MEKNTRKLITQGESQKMEFKASLSSRKEIGQTISAFTNTDGGVILVGIDDKGKIIGVNCGKKTIEDLANWIKQNTDPQIYPNIKICELNSKSIIKVSVKESDEKPVFFKNHAFQRVGKTNQRILASKIRELAKQEKIKLHWDERVCKGSTLKDIDKDRVREFVKQAKRERGLDIKPEKPIKEILMRLKLVRNGKLTNTALLLFGKDPQDYFLQSEVKCIRFKGVDVTGEMIDIKIVEGSAINQVETAEKFIFNNIKKAAWIEPGKIQRQEKWEYPPDAIREGLVNAIVHRDYQTTSKVQVRIFDNRMEIWNPGKLPKELSIEDLKKEHKSIPRNPLIARLFFWIKYIEEVGTGTNKIISSCIKQGLPEPDFKEISGDFVLIFRQGQLTEEYLEKLGLNQRQLRAVEYLKENKKITRQKYASLFRCSIRTAFNDLQEMINKQVLQRKGKGKYTYYELV